MVLIILGVLLIVFTGVVIKQNPQAARFASTGRIAGFVILAIGVVSSCVVQVEPG